ncbi:uncharacterized protein SOCE26_012640 [Sorangium cellulosum]|uniref:Uncharacterized protein n=1 Tax=Sorangium cellulosum TaxID=56 RepID=A0A2L0EKQ0_SORCE|nr:uncharacterized protein SOCE26_012640 [Sorangium cellulosum]
MRLRGLVALCGESDRQLKVSVLKQLVYGAAMRSRGIIARFVSYPRRTRAWVVGWETGAGHS